MQDCVQSNQKHWSFVVRINGLNSSQQDVHLKYDAFGGSDVISMLGIKDSLLFLWSLTLLGITNI